MSNSVALNALAASSPPSSLMRLCLRRSRAALICVSVSSHPPCVLPLHILVKLRRPSRFSSSAPRSSSAPVTPVPRPEHRAQMPSPSTTPPAPRAGRTQRRSPRRRPTCSCHPWFRSLLRVRGASLEAPAACRGCARARSARAGGRAPRRTRPALSSASRAVRTAREQTCRATRSSPSSAFPRRSKHKKITDYSCK